MRRVLGREILRAGWVTSLGSLVAQLFFMLPAWRRWPQILLRDSRMAAAVPLGPRAFTLSVSVFRALAWAISVHFLVALSDALAVSLLAEMPVLRRGFRQAPSTFGAVYGLAAYGFRFHVLPSLGYPWFRSLRAPAYLLTHVAHGMLTVLVLKHYVDKARTEGDA